MSSRESMIQSDKVELFVDLVRKYLLPNFKISSSMAIVSAAATKANYATLSQSDCFDAYYGSSYHYRGENKFIHFTSFETCLKILESKKFLLSSLSVMDDKLEVDHLHNIFESLGLKERESYFIKKDLYALSLCEFDVEQNEESLDMWRIYSDNCRGVGLVLEFDLAYSYHWVHYALSKVKYGHEGVDKIIAFSKAYQEFIKSNNGFKIRGIDELLRNLLSNHKSGIYKSEREVRLLFTGKLYEKELKLKHSCEIEFESKLRKEDFEKYKVTQERLDHIFPNITISSILIGPKVSKKEFDKNAQEINVLTQRYNTVPKVEHSLLKKYF
ncbi:DUF2971 domain-containing protein [Flammeovirgaceae bacterium SG7u.111]|nr:DUF2971 domain-containing protein [Flammeovirgaceae bacterium SG7u.132]WPO33015.1 DUF2971 domain-containing protein [Flammeovirgaceae bacterium SG7u.111]